MVCRMVSVGISKSREKELNRQLILLKQYKCFSQLYTSEMAASFEELIKGGRYSMSIKYNPAVYLPVSVYKHPYDNHAIIVKYLDSEQRGARMALYKSQIKNNLCIFTKNRHNPLLNTHSQPTTKQSSTPTPSPLDIFLMLYAWLVLLQFLFAGSWHKKIENPAQAN